MSYGNALGKLEWFNYWLSRFFNWTAICGIILIMFISFIDVVGAKAFGRPLLGAMEITEVTQLVVLAGALAYTQIFGMHVRVQFVSERLPTKIRASLKAFTSLLGFGLFSLIVWRSFEFAQMIKSSGEVSGTILIPFYPFAFWLALSCIPLCLVLLVEFIKSILEAFSK